MFTLKMEVINDDISITRRPIDLSDSSILKWYKRDTRVLHTYFVTLLWYCVTKISASRYYGVIIIKQSHNNK